MTLAAPIPVRYCMRAHVHHRQSALWKNYGANRIVAGNNPIRMVDPDGREGEDITIYNALKNGVNPLAVLGGHASKTMVDAVNNAPSIIGDMAIANPEANAEFAMFMAAPVAGSLMGAGNALAADALATAVPQVALTLSNGALSRPELYVYAKEGADAVASFIGPPSPCEGLGSCIGAAIALAYDEIPTIFTTNDSDGN